MKATRFTGPAVNVTPARAPRTPFSIPQRAAERAAVKYVEDAAGCHISTYSTGSHGYAQIGWQVGEGRRRATTAHRAAWVYAHGVQIPEGMTIDHLCKERRCVNPEHLRLLTNFENARRTDGRDWPIGECANGHPNSEVIRTSKGRHHCRTCMTTWDRTYQAKRRELRNATEEQS